MDVTFRVAGQDEAEVVLGLMEEYYAEDGYGFEVAAARRAVTEMLSDASLGRVWLIAEETVVIGYLVLTLGYSFEYQGREGSVRAQGEARPHRPPAGEDGLRRPYLFMTATRRSSGMA